MITAVERLQSLRVADVMSRDVITVSANATLSEAATLLTEHQISGAPVIDEVEQCVGVLSTTDIARCEALTAELTTGEEQMLVSDEDSGVFHIERTPEVLVKHMMNHAPQTIDAGRSLIDAARYMQCQHIHRVVVVDECARPVGVLSSLDIVAALVNSIDEQSA